MERSTEFLSNIDMVVRRYAASWSKEEQEASAAAYVPLTFDPGEAYQFDWSHEIVVIDGATTTVKVAHVRLCHSRMLFVRAYRSSVWQTRAGRLDVKIAKQRKGNYFPEFLDPRRGQRRP
jgi:hypothetical protein